MVNPDKSEPNNKVQKIWLNVLEWAIRMQLELLLLFANVRKEAIHVPSTAFN
jgi:hypothetical protein